MSDFDAIVIGSGMSGGWSAKELAERGLKVLILDRGKKITWEDYSDMQPPWEKTNFDQVSEEDRATRYPSPPEYAMKDSNKHFWAREDEQPFETAGATEFRWARGYSSGGKSLLWSRQSYRFGPQDFTANAEDGHGVDWPIRYDDLVPWYDRVETFAGIAGSYENLPQLPDSVFQPAFGLNCVEQHLRESVAEHLPTRAIIPARVAHLTEPTQEQYDLRRGKCLGRSLCHHGCSYGAYFSSVSATLPAAERTGNVTHIAHAVVHSLDYDDESGRVTGVHVIDAETRERRTYTGRLIVLNASTIPTTMIMLNSRSERFPNGLANDSDQLGRNMMDHCGGGWVTGTMTGFDDRYYQARRPAGFYVPRFANITEHDVDFVRGYGYQGGASRGSWTSNRRGIGAGFKQANRTPSTWTVGMGAFGEVLPNPDNRMTLHPNKTDIYGLPIAVFDMRMGENELKMMQHASKAAAEMLAAAGAQDIRGGAPSTPEDTGPMGDRIHEMGTACMGRDPATSVLNGWNQAHAIHNLIVSDGACMTSSACQNPSLTYMALAARAANHAADLMAEGVL